MSQAARLSISQFRQLSCPEQREVLRKLNQADVDADPKAARPETIRLNVAKARQ